MSDDNEAQSGPQPQAATQPQPAAQPQPVAQTRPALGRRAALPVLGAFVVGAIAYAPPYCFPLLSGAFGHEFEISRTLAVTPWTIFLLVTALASPLLGRAYDIFPDRTLLAIGMGLLGIGWVVASWATDISLLIVAFGVFLALGIQLVFVGTSTAIARRYPGVAGLALGTAYAGPGIGLAVALPIVAPLMPVLGWHQMAIGFALLTLAGFPFVWIMTSGPAVIVPATPAPAPPPRTAGPGGARTGTRTGTANTGLHETSAVGAVGASQEAAPAGSRTKAEGLRRTLRTRRFWVLLLGAVALGSIDEGVYQTFQPHAVQRGIDADFASQALALQALTYVVGQVVGGGLSDRFGRRYIGLLVALGILAGATGAFVATGSMLALALAGNALYGFAIGATIAIRSAVFSDVFGGRNFGAIFGIMAMAYPTGGIIVMYSGALLFDRLGNYWPVYLIAMAALVVWVVALTTAGPRRHGLRARIRSVRARLAG